MSSPLNSFTFARQRTPAIEADHIGAICEPTPSNTMHEVLPNFVTVGDDDTPWSVNYNALFSYSIGATKELDGIVTDLSNNLLAFLLYK